MGAIHASISRLLALTVALPLLLGLTLLTTYGDSRSHVRVLRLFAYSLFVLLGLLPFGPHRIEPPVQGLAAQTSHSA